MTEYRASVDQDVYDVLDRISAVTKDLGTHWFVVGAYARILLFEQNLGLPPGRTTMDIDVGIMVDSWDAYASLTASLCDTRGYHIEMTGPHRFSYGGRATFDVIPFGLIGRNDRILRWPPDDDPVMSSRTIMPSSSRSMRRSQCRWCVPRATSC